MKAITYEVRLDTFFLGKAVGPRFPEFYWGPFAGLRYGDRPKPARRADDWAIVDVTMAGVCGSDMAAVTYKTSPALTPFTSFPSVLGHEIVGRIAEAGPALQGFKAGDRVVVEPFLTCASRGHVVACEACREGRYCLCHNTAEGPMAPGMIMGACRDHTGGWAEHCAAHQSQLFKLHDDLPDELGVLVEPLSIGVHAVLRKLPAPNSRVLVIGAGMIAYSVIAALRWLVPGVRIAHATQLPYQRDAGLALGVEDAICSGDGTELAREVARLTGAKLHRPLIGRQVLAGGGFEQVFDCVGVPETIQDAFYCAKPGGTIVLVGAPGEIPNLDWTFVWSRELTIVGTLGYGLEDFQGERIRTFDLTMRLMRERPQPLAGLITHRFPLRDFERAMRANLDRAAFRSIKTVFTPSHA